MKTPHNSVPNQPIPLPLIAQDIGAVATIKEGVGHEVNDWVKLELTAEQMLQNEAQWMHDYVVDDAKGFWRDLKDGFIQWELTAGEYLLTAADPTRVEWQKSHVWGDEESQFH